MNTEIRYIEEKDRQEVLKMMRIFYTSEAVLSNGSEEIYNSDITNCINDNPYVEGYIFESNNKIQGYGMLAKSFSTEFGKQCIWVEDIYIKEEYRGLGIGSCFLKFVEKKYPNSILRLDVEDENERAVNVYKKCGFNVLPYMEMIKHN